MRERNVEVRGFDTVPTADFVGDVCDIHSLRAAATGIRAIVHLAGLANNVPDTARMFDVNVAGTWNVLLAAEAAGIERVVVASSIQALGVVTGRPPETLPLYDDYPGHPQDGYEISKHLVEEVCRVFTEQRGLSTICLRPTLVTHPDLYYAEWRSSDNARTALSEDSPRGVLDLYSWLDAEDFTEAVALSLDAELDGFHALLLAAADTLVSTPTADLLARRYPSTPFELRSGSVLDAGDPFHAMVDCSEAARVLGWRAQHRRVRMPTD